MEAAVDIRLNRTVGDTDPFLTTLTKVTDDGDVPVPDTATVVMHVKPCEGDVIVINGVPKGDSSGRFSFDSAGLATNADPELKFEVQVTDGVIFTIGYGTITQRQQIG